MDFDQAVVGIASQPFWLFSGSASWALDVDIGADVFQQIDPLQVDSW